MQIMPVRWKVKELREVHSLTPYRFMKESGLAQGTVYRLVNGDTQNLNASTLDATIKALRALTGKQVDIPDVLEYREDA
jgi:predicted transcriptional regulator